MFPRHLNQSLKGLADVLPPLRRDSHGAPLRWHRLLAIHWRHGARLRLIENEQSYGWLSQRQYVSSAANARQSDGESLRYRSH